MEQPLNILWKKTSSPKSDLYIDIYESDNIPDHQIFLDRLAELIDSNFQAAILAPIKGKDDSLAKHERECGKKLFSEKKYLEAMDKFNCGLGLAENGSAEIGLAIANRSSCFYHLQMLDKCLVDIEMAKNSNYPEQLKDKLEARLAKCSEAKKNDHFMDGVFIAHEPKLSFDENPEYEGVANCLKIHENDEYGRHIITTRDLKIGQTILIEQPFAAIDKRFYMAGHSRCHSCFERCQNFITCENCVVGQFCDVNCLRKFHKYECNMPDNLSQKETFELVLRIFFSALEAFPNIETLMKTVESMLCGTDIPGLGSAAQQAFCLVFKLPHNHNKQSHGHLNQLRSATIVAIITLMRFKDFKQKFSTPKQQRFLQHFILHLFHVAEHHINLFECSEIFTESSNTYTLAPFATGMYPFGCHFKYSCVPNVTWFFINSRLVCKVIRPVKKGEQLFRAY